MPFTEQTVTSLKSDGYVLVEEYLEPGEVAAAHKFLREVFPSWEEYSSKPDRYPDIGASSVKHWAMRGFPQFPAELHLNVLKPELIEFARRFIGTTDVVCDQSLISGKYAGRHTQDQDLHADFSDHTLVFADDAYITGALYYVDTTVGNGATWIVSRKDSEGIERWPNMRPRAMEPALYEHEHPVEGPAGSLLIYTLDTFHRGAAFLDDAGARFNHHFSYRPAHVPWMGVSSWPAYGDAPEMSRLLQMCTVEQRNAMGFPKPGDAYWTPHTLAGVQARYPDMDLTAYRR